MTDYELGVEHATDIYKEVIREYVAENEKLRDVARELFRFVKRTNSYPRRETFARQELIDDLRELGVIDR